MIQLNKRAATNLEAIRNQKFLIHNITNYVVMNTTVNALLCVGASSVMTHAVNEVEEMAGFHHCRTGLLSRWSDGDACALPPQGD